VMPLEPRREARRLAKGWKKCLHHARVNTGIHTGNEPGASHFFV
jgi:hypothetical protein